MESGLAFLAGKPRARHRGRLKARRHRFRRKAKRVANGKRRQCVRHIVPPRKRESVRLLFSVGENSGEPRLHAILDDLCAAHVRVFAFPERHDGNAFSRFPAHRQNARVVRVQYRRAACGQRLHHFGFRLRDILDRAKQLDMRLPDVRDDADGRRRKGRKRRNLSETAHADLHHRRPMFRAQTQQRLRQPDFIVEIRFRTEHRETRPQHRRSQILRGRLAVGSGDGDDWQGKFRPPRMGDFLICS